MSFIERLAQRATEMGVEIVAYYYDTEINLGAVLARDEPGKQWIVWDCYVQVDTGKVWFANGGYLLDDAEPATDQEREAIARVQYAAAADRLHRRWLSLLPEPEYED